MAAEREYKQRCDNPSILSAMKVPSCEMRIHQVRMHLFGECRSWSEPVPSHPGTNTTGSAINNSPHNIRPSWLFGCYSEWFISFASLSCCNPTFVCVKMSKDASVLFEISANSCSSLLVFINGGYTRWSRGNLSVHKLPLSLPCWCVWLVAVGGGVSVWHHTSVHRTLQPMAADGEKTQAEEKEEWVTKQPGVTLVEWKQKPSVWKKTIRPMKIHPLLRAKTSTRRL